MTNQENIIKTKEILITNGGEKVNDNYYRYHGAFKEFKIIDPVEKYETYGYMLIIHKVSEDSKYYMASEIATGRSIGGSCISIEGLKKMIDATLSTCSGAYHQNLLHSQICPRYKSKEITNG